MQEFKGLLARSGCWWGFAFDNRLRGRITSPIPLVDEPF
jgi:hypothetical protein